MLTNRCWPIAKVTEEPLEFRFDTCVKLVWVNYRPRPSRLILVEQRSLIFIDLPFIDSLAGVQKSVTHIKVEPDSVILIEISERCAAQERLE